MANFLENSTFLSSDTPTSVDPDSLPPHIVAADNHNLGNLRGGSWLDPQTYEDKFYGAGKMIAAGMLSGANSFYNTGVAVGNWFGNEAEYNDTKEWISGIDDDLGQYYGENRGAADLVGFVASSLIPGLAGVKVLNAGQAALKVGAARGMIGSNLSRATGLLTPSTESFIVKSAGQISEAGATFSTLNVNTAKALAAGVWQNTLEAAAFETAVQATMFKSPILEGQDGWDIVKNIAIGGLVGGAIGGSFEAATTFGKLKKLVSARDLELKPFSSRVIAQEGTSPAERIILAVEDKNSTSLLDLPEGDLAARRALDDKIRRTDNEIRTQTHRMVVGEDSELGNMVADTLHGANNKTALGNLLHTDEVTRLTGRTTVESELAKAAKAGEPRPDLVVQYVKLHGEGAGVITDAEPLVANLADRVRVSAKTSTEAEVLKEVRDHGFKSSKAWDPMALKGAAAHLEAEARYIWASSPELLKEIKAGTNIHMRDLPLLERALKDGSLDINLVDSAGQVVQKGFSSTDELGKYLIDAKQSVASDLLRAKVLEGGQELEAATQKIAKITNTKLSRLEGTQVGKDSEDFFAWQSAKSDYTSWLEAQGLKTPANKTSDPRFLPTYAKVTKRVKDLEDVDGNVLDGMAWIKTKQKMLQEAVDNVIAHRTGALATRIPTITDDQLITANRYGAGAGLLKFANGGYGSLESTAQLLGSLTKELKTSFRKSTQDTLELSIPAVAAKQEAAIEFETINQKITRSAKQWIIDQDGSIGGTPGSLVSMDLRDAVAKNAGESMNDLLDDVIAIKNPETFDLVRGHISRTGDRTAAYKELRAAQGLEEYKDPGVFRPIRPNPQDYPYFAFVKDPRVTGQGHTTMIHAASEAKLQEMITKVPGEFKVLTKRDAEEFFQARNEYEFQRTLHESYIDSSLKNRGVFSNFYSKTDPQKIVNDLLKQHLRDDDILAVELMRAKNQRAFDWLEDQGRAYTKIEASRFGSSLSRIEQTGKNPYTDFTKTALDISKVSEHPLLYAFNKTLDDAVSKGVGAIRDTFNEWKNPLDDKAIGKIQSTLDQYGMRAAYHDAAVDLLANHSAPRGELTRFIRGANAILSKLTLGLDPMNSLNNFIGANVLRSTELNSILTAVRRGDRNVAGDLVELASVKLPTGESILNFGKLQARAYTNWMKDPALMKQYQEMGLVKDAGTQFAQILDDFTLKGTETATDLQSRLGRALQKAKTLSETGEKFTGNKLAEELNRFVSADIMRQLTDPLVAAGKLNRSEQAAYMNTFVNRIEGNTIASQRPLMFQGPVGQAIGLFQSYQFNLMQQMFRYVAEGGKKDMAMLLGLQSTFYGIQGLPAFQFINQHIVGTASGNKNHTDLYDATYGVTGRMMGDLLMYGIPSNILQANLYSRGDINPRQITILPTSLPDVPIVGAFTKFLGSMKTAFTNVSNGAPLWESFLQGMEHNGLSRPMAGIAQSLQAFGEGGKAYSTSSKGSILFSNDLMSWATAVRLSGARPLDEAILNDGVFRIQSYQGYDTNKKKALAQAIKTSAIQGNQPGAAAIAAFAQRYAEVGGKQVQFNKFMMNEFKSANTSRAVAISESLKNPFTQKMQVLMGGRDLESLSQSEGE